MEQALAELNQKIDTLAAQVAYLADQAQLAERQREERATSLYLLTRELAQATDFADLLAIVIREVSKAAEAEVALSLADETEGGNLTPYFASTWLLNAKERYPLIFLVTSSSVLHSMFGDFLGDRWSGFRQERDRLLRFIGDHHIENVYLLAGDLHSSHFMTAECGPADDPVLIREFCSTPFEQTCNKYAHFLYTSIRTGAVHHPIRYYCIAEPNYGIVNVHFSAGRPHVDFSMFGTDGHQLAPMPRS